MQYNFNCDNCKNTIELKWTFSEHSLMKDSVICETCGEKRYQAVAPLNFRLKGDCWYSRDGGNNSAGVGYEMTDNSMKASRDEVAKLEDIANNYTEKYTPEG